MEEEEEKNVHRKYQEFHKYIFLYYYMNTLGKKL